MKYLLACLSLFVALPTQACDLKTYSKQYVNQIQKVVGGEKPLVRVQKYRKNVLGDYTYALQTITVYSSNYEGECEYVLPSLKSLIAHEYGHHLSKQISKVTGSDQEESIAHLAEHSFGDKILKDTEYDNELTESGQKKIQKLDKNLKGLFYK